MTNLIDRTRTIYSYLKNVCPSYEEGNVDKKATFPYLTYSMVEFGEQFSDNSLTVRIFSNSTSSTELLKLTEQFTKLIGEGVKLPLINNVGYLYLFKGSPYIQKDYDLESKIKSMYINITYKIL